MTNSFAVIELSGGEEAMISPEDRHWISQRAWYLDANGYAACNVFGGRKGRNILMHRVILLARDTSEVDHIDRNRTNNCRWNLRIATRTEQMQNTKSANRATSYRGVQYNGDHTSTVSALIKAEGKRHYLGCYKIAKIAAMAYDIAARELYGQHARVNFADGEYPADLKALVLDRLARSMNRLPFQE